MFRFPASMIGEAVETEEAELLKAKCLAALHWVSESRDRSIRRVFAKETQSTRVLDEALSHHLHIVRAREQHKESFGDIAYYVVQKRTCC